MDIYCPLQQRRNIMLAKFEKRAYAGSEKLWVGTGGEAKYVISEGMVTVNGEVCTQRGKKLRPGDRVSFAGNELEIERG